MSRLDDELKVAFRRREPSPDFAARVLARINDAPAPQVRPGLWQRLGGMFAMPAWRYAAVGAMAMLLVMIGVALLRSNRTATNGNEPPPMAAASGDPAEKPSGGTATQEGATASNAATGVTAGGSKAVAKAAGARTEAAASPRPVKGYRAVRHHAPVIARQAQPSAEAEAAKEKVLFALQITNEALNDVQRAISDENRPNDENPEPVHNR